MTKKTTAEEYLAKAAGAEAIADKLADGFLKRSWLDIAEGYRDLAKSQTTTERPTNTAPQD